MIAFTALVVLPAIVSAQRDTFRIRRLRLQRARPAWKVSLPIRTRTAVVRTSPCFDESIR